MNKMIRLPLLTSLLVCLAAPMAKSDVFFADDFSNGSTIVSMSPAEPTANSTAYQLLSAKSWVPNPPTLVDNDLTFGIGSSSSGTFEIQALFATNAIALTQPGDYIQLAIVFTNTSGVLAASGQLGIGLYNSGQVQPLPGGTNNATTGAEIPDYAQGWMGYMAILGGPGNSSRIFTRPAQTITTGNCQDLIANGSGSQAYQNASSIGSSYGDVTVSEGSTLTEVFSITMVDANTLGITNTLYSGAGVGGTVLTNYGGEATGSTFLTAGFDGLALGYRSRASGANNTIDVSSIEVSGSVTVISTPPAIVTQPVAVTVPSGGSCAFDVEAQGFNMTYQWCRYGTNLMDGGNISGATSSQLIISPASSADVASGANGYYVVVSGAGGYSTNSVTNSLTLGTAKNLVYSGFGPWDLNTSSSWVDASHSGSYMFNYGDSVTFDDFGGGGLINLNGSYLSASSVTVSHTGSFYTFQGSGSFAGPGSLIYNGSGLLNINNANTYTGGTIISNASANLRLGNYDGLGTGPVTLASGLMEILNTGSSSLGINGDVNVVGDFTIKLDGTGAYATVFKANLSGTAGKTLTLEPNDLSTTNRYRVYGSSTVYNANLVLDGPSTDYANYNGTVLAPYNSSGSQVYNGVISGPGGLVQRGSKGETILNGANTYSGGTTPTTGSIGFGIDTVGTVTSGPIGTGPLYLAPELPNTTGSGTVFASGGARTVANPLQYPSATNNLTLIVGGTNDLTFSGPYTLNGNDGNGTYTNRTLQVDNTGLTTISGVISGAGFSFTKTGNGVLALSNTETYDGTTTVSAGELLVNGQLGSGAVTASGGVIGGNGTIPGSVTVQSGGGLAPGSMGIGHLTINSTLDLQAGSTTTVEVNKTGGTQDQVTANTVNYGGTLMATNISGTISMGDSFPIFSATSHTGDFSAIAGSPGAGMAWSFDAASGMLSVVAGVNTNPTNIVFSVSGGTLSLSWPSDHTGWTLEVQTNSLANGLQSGSGSWFAVPGSTSTNAMDFPVDPANGSVFYRLIYQP